MEPDVEITERRIGMESIYAILQQVRDDVDYAELEDFVEAEALDSIDIMTLVELLEEHFSIQIGGKDIIPENFRNVKTIDRKSVV